MAASCPPSAMHHSYTHRFCFSSMQLHSSSAEIRRRRRTGSDSLHYSSPPIRSTEHFGISGKSTWPHSRHSSFFATLRSSSTRFTSTTTVILVFLVFVLRTYILGKRWVFALV